MTSRAPPAPSVIGPDDIRISQRAVDRAHRLRDDMKRVYTVYDPAQANYERAMGRVWTALEMHCGNKSTIVVSCFHCDNYATPVVHSELQQLPNGEWICLMCRRWWAMRNATGVDQPVQLVTLMDDCTVQCKATPITPPSTGDRSSPETESPAPR